MRTGLTAMLIILCMAVAFMFPAVAEDVSEAILWDRELPVELIKRTKL